jgi:RND family efflux transporter MFP subunit
MPGSTDDLSSLRIDRDSPPPRSSGAALRILLASIAVVVLVGAALYVFASRRGTEVRVALAEATGGGISSVAGITANGYVVARTKASVSAKIPGRLEYLGVTEGSFVREGEIMARIESADYDARLRAATATAARVEAELTQARRDLKRAQDLRQREVYSDLELETAETSVDVLEAQLRATRAEEQVARVNLENTRVRAPFDGTVLRKDAEVGEYVAPSSAGGGLTRTAIVTMADLATLEVEVDVNEAYIAQIRNTQPARIILDAYPDTSFAGRVRQVVPTADRRKATVQVKVSILDSDPRILPEMGAKVVFEHGENTEATASAPRRVLVPREAVVATAEGGRVWIVEEGKAASRPVDIGAERNGRTGIRRGLGGGESVIVSPPTGLRDGDRVRVKN